MNFIAYRDAAIKDYRAARYARGTIPTNNALRGQALMRDFYRGRIPAREAVDFDKLAKYWVLTNVWGGCHGTAWHNRRYYYSPISGLLEPVSYDNVPAFAKAEFRYCVPEDVKAALKDPLFREKVVIFASELNEEFQSDMFRESLADQQAYYDNLLELEDFAGRRAVYTPEFLTENLVLFLGKLDKGRQHWTCLLYTSPSPRDRG